MNESILAHAIVKAIANKFEISIRPPNKHIRAWIIELTYMANGDLSECMSRRISIAPDFIFFLPKKLNHLIELFKIDVDKVYNQKCEG